MCKNWLLISRCSFGAVPRREIVWDRVYLYVCVRDLVTMGLLIVPKGLNLVFVPLSPVLGVQVHICLWCASSWEWKNTFFCGSPGTQNTGDATPVQIMHNLFSMDSQWDIKLGSLNYPWPCMRDGEVQWQHQSLSLLGPNRDLVIRKQLNAKQIKKEMGSPGTFSQFPA